MTAWTRAKRVLVIGGVFAVFGAGLAYAAIPGADGTINGCYEKRTGLLRVIDAEAGKKCLSIETPISWNQKGLPGVNGVDGKPGEPGKDGISVTSDALGVGDPTCAHGGSRFTANGVTYACNGAPGNDGAPGAKGDPGVGVEAVLPRVDALEALSRQQDAATRDLAAKLQQGLQAGAARDAGLEAMTTDLAAKLQQGLQAGAARDDNLGAMVSQLAARNAALESRVAALEAKG